MVSTVGGDRQVSSYVITTKRIPRFLHQFLRSVNAFDEKVGPVAAHVARFGDVLGGRL